MRHYFNTNKRYVLSEDDRVYEVYSYETYDDSTFISVNLRLIGSREGVQWFMAKYMSEEIQEESVSQYFMVESMNEALESNGYKTILELPAPLAEVIANEYSNGKYDEYHMKIRELCAEYAYKECCLCPLYAACNADIEEEDSKLRTAKWERGMAEAYEKLINK